MNSYNDVLQIILDTLSGAPENQEASNSIPVGISNRHIHLSQPDLELLFGKGYNLTKLKDLSQPGQYACKETLHICGPGGAIEKVRVLGPVRSKTQVEILSGDCFKLGISASVRLSGELDATPGLTLIGPKASVQITEGVIIAKRHIHMTPQDAGRLGVHDGQIVSIEIPGARGGIYSNTAIRATASSALECHVDIEEANAMGIDASTQVTIL